MGYHAHNPMQKEKALMKRQFSRSATLASGTALVLLLELLWSAVYFSLLGGNDILYYFVCLLLAFGAFCGLYAPLSRTTPTDCAPGRRDQAAEWLTLLFWFGVIAYVFYQVRYASFQELLYLPWHSSRRLSLLISLSFGCMLLLTRQMLRSGGAAEKPVRLWPWYVLLTVLCAHATYNPDCFSSYTNAVHRTAFYQSVYRVMQGQPFSVSNCGTYGYYGILIGPLVNLIDGRHTTFALIYAAIGGLSVAAQLYTLDRWVRNQWLRLFASLFLCLPYFGLIHIGYLQVTPHRLVFPALLLAALTAWPQMKKGWRAGLGLAFLALAFLWNFESGAACAVCLAGLTVYQAWRDRRSPGRVLLGLALRGVQIIAAFLAAYGLVNLYNLAVGGGWMGLSAFVFPYGSKAFADQLSLSLSQSLPAMWVLICVLLVVSVGVALKYVFFRDEKAPDQLVPFVGCVLVCAVQMVYYFNRSAESNLYICLSFAVAAAAWLCQYLLDRPRPCGPVRATACALTAVLVCGALLSTGVYFGVQDANELDRSKNRMDRVTRQLLETVPPDTLAICHGMPEAYSELGWDTGFYGLQTIDYGILSPEEQQRIYRQMMDAPGVIVDDVCLSMVEKHLGTDALQAFYDTHDLAHAFTGVESQCFYYARR